ncbi:carbon-nitrogen hydrolase family protein [Catellatospora methionotrophica]|uniref:Carbon-nitrogen hydrolase family protein n=1 Tax=Catellatospora methionotrophica TaxID=121620 RepID=A0A8J3LH19_9ACTN|nr:hypothetical protein [Catellatospora methionotrophica]GIG12450.1 carbon-nitrogen hydrolase family protein [Catellatospora methionotrophica]
MSSGDAAARRRISAPLGRGGRFARLLALLVVVPWTLVALSSHGPALVSALSGTATGTGRPSAAECASYRSPGRVPVTGHQAPGAKLRVFAVGYHLNLDHAASYATWRTAMRCLMEDTVVPHLSPGVPTLVVFPEDIGLPTIGVGARGAGVRAQAGSPARAASDAVPLGMAGALAQLNIAYAPQIAAYQLRFGGLDPRKQAMLAATDTFARAFSRTFSEIARDYGVYVVAGNNQARYRVSRDPAEVALFADPALKSTGVAYVATSARVTNSTFLWGPRDVDAAAPQFETNLLFRNEKVPLTALELDLLGLDEGPATGPAALANASGVDVAGFTVGFATSLPAFAYGYPFGQRPAGFDPCADLRVSYAACQDHLGVDLMVQADANPGRWATAAQSGGWQPLEWMGSTWRAVADPTVGFRYNVTPMMTGNLFDLVFDGQSAITGRGAQAVPRRYVGTAAAEATDPAAYGVYAGAKPEFLALSPWAAPDGDRAGLAAAAGTLAPGSGSAREDGYAESVIYADLT